MSMADLTNFIHGDPVMGTLFVIFAVICGLCFLALPIGIIWGITKSGKTAMFSAAVYLVLQGAGAYKMFPDRGGLLMALGFVAAGIILFIIAMRRLNKRELTPQEAEELTNRETRSVLHSKSGKFLALLTAATCFGVVWVIKNEKPDENTASLILVFFLFGCAGVLAFIFPSQTASVLEVIGKLLPNRRRYE